MSTRASADEARLASQVARFCKLAAISTDVLRAQAAARELSALSPAEACAALNVLLRRRRDEAAASTAVIALSRALARGNVDQDLVEQIRACAASRADRLVEALLASGPAQREYDKNDEQFIDRRMRRLTLGERRALSRSRDIDMLVRLAHDQDPRVIRELLLNPRITEREAVLIASRRPTHAHVLATVLASRFGTSQRVRKTVAHNPYSPLALAVRAMAALQTQALRDIVDDERVSPELRDRARALMIGRRGTPAELTAAPTPAIDHAEISSLIDQLEPASAETEPITAVSAEGEVI